MGGTRKSERSQCKGSDATQGLDKNDSQILNWIIEFASSHGNHQIIKGAALAAFPWCRNGWLLQLSHTARDFQVTPAKWLSIGCT